MYQVVLTKKCSEELIKNQKSGALTTDELILIRTWISEMKTLGPEYIETCRYCNDHSLKGSRAGQRSSSFSEEGRIIYKVKKNKVEISVVKITQSHGYS